MIDMNKFNQWLKENGYPKIKTNINTNIIVIGEEHDNEPDNEGFREKKSLISLLKPRFVLHEFGKIYEYDPPIGQEQYLPGYSSNNVDFPGGHFTKEFKEIADEFNFKLIGCDIGEVEYSIICEKIAKNEPDKYIIDIIEGMRFVSTRPDVSEDYDLHHGNDKVALYRNKRMADRTLEYAKKTLRPIITIAGKDHVKRGNNFHQILSRKVDYITLYQKDKFAWSS